MPRKVTIKILEMVGSGALDRDFLILCCLKYMSEHDVADMARCNEIPVDEEEYQDE